MDTPEINSWTLYAIKNWKTGFTLPTKYGLNSSGRATALLSLLKTDVRSIPLGPRLLKGMKGSH